MNRAASDDPVGRPPPGLVDLVTRHFDGSLPAEEQRRLADWLASSPAARATFARCLRLEGGMIRLAAAGLLGRRTPTDGAAVPTPAVPTPAVPTPAVPTSALPTVPAARLRAGVIAIAGGLIAAVVLVVTSGGLPERGGPRAAGDRGSIDRVADCWLERRAAEPAANATGDADDDDPAREADDPGTDAAQPPSWLVAAVADEHAEATRPDAS